MEVKPKIGLEQLIFGMSRNEVLDLLGRPDQIKADELDATEQHLEWHELKLRLTFSSAEQDRLTYIVSTHPDLHYAGHKLIDEGLDKLKDEVFADLNPDWEFDDYGRFQTHFDETHWLSLHSEFGKLTEIQIGVPFKNEIDYQWPE